MIKVNVFLILAIRINSVTKVYPDSPVMSEIIKGVFKTFDEHPINFDSIKKGMYGTEEKQYHSIRVQKKIFKRSYKKGMG